MVCLRELYLDRNLVDYHEHSREEWAKKVEVEMVASGHEGYDSGLDSD
jgi:hypothetical protein